MSTLIKESIKRQAEISDQLIVEKNRTRDIFISYLIVASQEMEESEKLIFHDSMWPTRQYHNIELSRNGVVYGGRNYILLDYLIHFGMPYISESGMKRALEDIEQSFINKRIKLETVMEKYDEYVRLKGETSKKIALKFGR